MTSLDRAVDIVADHKDAWARTPVRERIELLRRCIHACIATAPEIVRESCRAKGLPFDAAPAAEEWLSGPVPVVRNLRLLIDTLCDIARHGRPRLGPIGRAPTGELTAAIFPRDRFDAVLFPGVAIVVWMQPDVAEQTFRDTIATVYRDVDHARGRVAVVLGAGNVSSIGPMDLLTKLVVENHAVILKTHPINAYLAPLLERAFEPLVSGGFLQIVTGDAADGQYLVNHPQVDEVHITGSAAVHDRIVWGATADEQARRRAANTPMLTKRITSELGCVTPVIVVPGDWTASELQYQAENVATMVAHNASCNCNAAKLLVTSRHWNQRRAFLDTVEAVLASLRRRRCYYPGSEAKYAAFLDRYSHARQVGAAVRDGSLPYAVIPDVDPDAVDDLAFHEEAWSPVIAETALAAADAAEFINTAAQFCNARVAGTLSAVVLVDPRSEARLRSAIDRLIAVLRYGTISINHWSAVSYALAVPPWGAYPGHTLTEIGSGIGFVHNTLMFDRPLKTVLSAPFTTTPKPPWFVTHRRAHIVAERMLRFEAQPSWARVPGIALAAARSG